MNFYGAALESTRKLYGNAPPTMPSMLDREEQYSSQH